MQKLTATNIDALYGSLKLAPNTMKLLHMVVRACLASAVKKKLIANHPAAKVRYWRSGGRI